MRALIASGLALLFGAGVLALAPPSQATGCTNWRLPLGWWRLLRLRLLARRELHALRVGLRDGLRRHQLLPRLPATAAARMIIAASAFVIVAILASVSVATLVLHMDDRSLEIEENR